MFILMSMNLKQIARKNIMHLFKIGMLQTNVCGLYSMLRLRKMHQCFFHISCSLRKWPQSNNDIISS